MNMEVVKGPVNKQTMEGQLARVENLEMQETLHRIAHMTDSEEKLLMGRVAQEGLVVMVAKTDTGVLGVMEATSVVVVVAVAISAATMVRRDLEDQMDRHALVAKTVPTVLVALVVRWMDLLGLADLTDHGSMDLMDHLGSVDLHGLADQTDLTVSMVRLGSEDAVTGAVLPEASTVVASAIAVDMAASKMAVVSGAADSEGSIHDLEVQVHSEDVVDLDLAVVHLDQVGEILTGVLHHLV